MGRCLSLRDLIADQVGAALAEYGLLVALIATVCVGAVTVLGTAVQGVLNNAAGGL